MPRRSLKPTDELYERWLKDGRGQGEYEDYIPFLQIGDFSSSGRGHRIKDHKNGRIHHFFSDLEAKCYYVFAWVDQIVDIREQYPLLPRTETEKIASELEIRHPIAPGAKCNLIMTTDFLLTVSDPNGTHLEARYVKYAKDLEKPRNNEKFEIERKYWDQRGVPIKIVTEEWSQLKASKNIEMLLSHYGLNLFASEPKLALEVSDQLVTSILEQPYSVLSSITSTIDTRYQLLPGTALNQFYHLAAHKLIPVHINQKLLPTLPCFKVVDTQALKATAKLEVLNERLAR